MNDLVSIIVPIYNVQSYLKQCLDSIVNQTYRDIEVILIDDGSTDDSGYICEEYKSRDERIKVIHQENSGLSHARNVGIEQIDNLSQSIIMFVDSDDFLELDAIEKLKKVMDETDSDIVKGYSFTLNQDKGVFSYYGDISKQGQIIFYDSMEAMRSLPVMVHGLLYRGKIFNHVRYPVARLHEDNWTTPRTYWLANRIAVLNHNVYCYRIRENSITNTLPTLKKMEDCYYALKSELLDWYFAGVPTLALERDLYALTSNFIAIIKSQYPFKLPNFYYELLYTNKAVEASIKRQEKELELK